LYFWRGELFKRFIRISKTKVIGIDRDSEAASIASQL